MLTPGCPAPICTWFLGNGWGWANTPLLWEKSSQALLHQNPGWKGELVQYCVTYIISSTIGGHSWSDCSSKILYWMVGLSLHPTGKQTFCIFEQFDCFHYKNNHTFCYFHPQDPDRTKDRKVRQALAKKRKEAHSAIWFYNIIIIM